MGKSKQIALGIGIAIILAVFSGFFAWQLGNDFENKCQLKETDNMLCCNGDALLMGPKLSANYYWVADNQECVSPAAVTDKSFCENSYFSSEKCSDLFKQWFGMAVIILGVIALAIGIMLKNNITIEGGLIGGAIINFVMGLIAYWDWLNGWSRVALAGIVLAGLIILAWYKLKD